MQKGTRGKRYYFGCDNYDEMEVLAQERAKKLFSCNFANVQPHSGASANIAAFLAFMNPGDVYKLSFIRWRTFESWLKN